MPRRELATILYPRDQPAAAICEIAMDDGIMACREDKHALSMQREPLMLITIHHSMEC
ncbi:hypothetical protein BC831DRAFT_397848 [Entophlyctis helioformis]|nr:hypothetical protein BC831DRAFT_397848 [Entophlyctis helioformis]